MSEKKLSNEILEKYKIRIEEEIVITRKVLQGLKDYQKNHEGHNNPACAKDIAKYGTDTNYQELQGTLSEKEYVKLTKLRKALKRIDNGTYGICFICGCYIPESRLEIVPYARYCVECKTREENIRNH